MGEYNSRTPFAGMQLAHLRENNEAFRQALERVPFSPRRVVEPFGGIGSQSRVLRRRWPTLPEHVIFERDPTTFQLLEDAARDWAPRPVLINRDYVPMPFLGCDLLVADCNNFTLHSPRWAEYRDALCCDAGAIILTDLARGKLHLNFRAYDLERGDTYEDYLERLAQRLDRPLLGHALAPKSITYIALGAPRWM